jgi:glycosyltransferase involved in cell wall biosynthesis
MRDAPVVHRSFVANLLERLRPGDVYGRWAEGGAAFGRFAAQEFSRCGLTSADTVIGYTAANLEQLRLAKERGAKALHVQVDPGLTWYETRRREQLAHPEAEDLSPMPGEGFVGRIRQEWQAADKVIVHSAHSRDALVAQGAALDRCVIIPPAFKCRADASIRRRTASKPFRVLFVGNHCLAKGFHVFVEAAQAAGRDFQFVSVGRSVMRADYLKMAMKHVELLGPKTQAGVREEMAKADVLVFPTLSDGFGLVQLEAMAEGLPVIATPCCGEVVRHRTNGLIIPPGDAQAIVEALHELRADEEMFMQLSLAASMRAQDYSAEVHFQALLAR